MLARFISGRRGNFSIYLVADCEPRVEQPNDRPKLRGKMYSVISGIERDESIKRRIDQFERLSEGVPEEFSAIRNDIDSLRYEASSATCLFTLDRSGFCDIFDVELNKTLHNFQWKGLLQLDLGWFSLRRFSGKEPKTIDELQVAAQFFYFLRDITHVHKFHDSTQDALTRISQGTSNNLDDVLAWARIVLKDYYRAVIRNWRGRGSGILSYAKSLEQIIERMAEDAGRIDELKDGFSFLDRRRSGDHKPLGDSLAATHSQVIQHTTTRQWRAATFGILAIAAWQSFTSDNPFKWPIDEKIFWHLTAYFAIGFAVLGYSLRISIRERELFLRFAKAVLHKSVLAIRSIILFIGAVGLTLILVILYHYIA